VPVRTDLDDLDIVVHRRGGRYLAKMPQVGLYAMADSLSKAIEVLEAKKNSLLAELSAADALDEISDAPSSLGARMQVLPGLTLFAAKGIIVMILFLFAVGIVRHVVQRDIERLQSPQIGGAQFWSGIENNIAQAADPANDMPAAKKQALLADIHVIVDRWRPFVREADRLFSDQDETSPGHP
jgi:hypothetical protein